jgi:hypothetical protein
MFVEELKKAWAAKQRENLITGFETSMNYAQDANPVQRLENGDSSSDQ